MRCAGIPGPSIISEEMQFSYQRSLIVVLGKVRFS